MRPKSPDPRKFVLKIRLSQAEHSLVFKHLPEGLTKSDWARRLLLLAAKAADHEPRIVEKLISRPLGVSPDEDKK